MNRTIIYMMLAAMVFFSGCVVEVEQNGYINGTIEITGYALGSNLSSYTVEIGESFNATQWSTTGVELISSGTSEIANGTLARWDTTAVRDGQYTIRLTVTDTNNVSSQDLVYVNVDNVFIDSPENGSPVSNADLIDIKGKAVGLTFTSYSIDYSPDNENWSAAGISLANNGTEKVDNDTLATWNTSYAENSGRHTLRLNVYGPGGLINSDNSTVILANYQAGWPQATGGNIYSSPAVGDLDNDGDLEIVVGSLDGYVYAWHHNGTMVAGWYQITQNYVRSSPTLSDLDNDGDLEVVVGSYDDEVYAWHHDANPVQGWSNDISDYSDMKTSPAISDLDGDGAKEIVVGAGTTVYAWHSNGSVVESEVVGDTHEYSLESQHPYDNYLDKTWTITMPGFTSIAVHFTKIDVEQGFDYLYVKDASGKTVNTYTGLYEDVWSTSVDGDTINITLYSDYMITDWGFEIDRVLNGSVGGWPREVGYDIFSSPALGDLDGDGTLEVVVGSYEGRLHAWHHDGTLVDGWPLELGDQYSYIEGSPALADIDMDGDLEIIVGLNSYTNEIHALHHSGLAVDGWPQNISYYFGSSPAVGDLNGDGTPEIAIGSGTGVAIFRNNGSLLAGWPQDTGDYIYSSPAIADLDCDGDLEILIGSIDGSLHAWHHNGSLVDGWPKETGDYIYSSPAVADLDGDGDLEVIVGSYDDKIHIWDESGSCSPYQIEWDKFSYNEMNTGWYEGDVTNTTATTSTTSTTTTSTSTTLPSCETTGDIYPCDGEVTLAEVLDTINSWYNGLTDIGDVIMAINNWANSG